MMEIILDPRLRGFTKKLSENEQGEILKTIDLFRNYGFRLPSKYLKKLESNLWELRPGKIRLLFGKLGRINSIVVVVGFKKKTQKTPKQEIKIAILRIKEYL